MADLRHSFVTVDDGTRIAVHEMGAGRALLLLHGYFSDAETNWIKYGHAALLVASCVAYAPKSRASEFLKWASDLRQQYWRRHAFRQELARACESLGVSLAA